MYNTEKNFNRLMNGQSTFFLDKKDVMLLKGKLRRDEYKIYYPYFLQLVFLAFAYSFVITVSTYLLKKK